MRSIYMCLLMGLVMAANANAAAPSREELRDQLQLFRVAQEKDPVPTGILYDLVVPLSGIERFDGTENSESADFSTWQQIAYELKRASLTETGIPDYREVLQQRQNAQRNGEHPLALLLFDYQRARVTGERDAVIGYSDGKVTAIKGDLLARGTVCALTPLHDWTYQGRDVIFSFDLNEVFTNMSEVLRIQFDFDDGLGLRDVPKDGKMSVSYNETGSKTIQSRIETRDGRVLLGRSRFRVRHLDAPPPSETWSLTASHSTGGSPATGEAYILYAPGHTMLTRPVVLVEGLDLDNSLNWDELYDLMNQELMIETLLSIGYDAVVLNYGNSTIDIRDNAYLVQELIEEVNSATGGVYPLVIAGTSLGGVTTRYALTYMEANSLPHNVETFISMDSPQNGANIPIGIQYWADFFSGESAEAAAARDALLTPAPRQLLLYHLSSSSSGIANADPLFAAFQNNLQSLGDYPQLPRLVSVINGSGTMQNSGFVDGAQILRWQYDSFLVDIRGNVWAVSDSINTRVLQGLIDVIWPLPDESRNVFIAPCLPWDNAPGGLTATMAELDSTAAPYGDIQALHPSHCFIPSVSALDLNTSNPFFNIDSVSNISELTPFDAVYYPVQNQDHVQITPENADWFLSEIIGPLDQPTLTISYDSVNIGLKWNNVFAANAYHLYSSLDGESWPVFVTVTDTNFTAAADDSMRFYRVQAVRE